MSNQKNHPLRTKGGSFDVKIERLVFLYIFSLLSDKSGTSCHRLRGKKQEKSRAGKAA